jgi:hypothetical protein
LGEVHGRTLCREPCPYFPIFGISNLLEKFIADGVCIQETGPTPDSLDIFYLSLPNLIKRKYHDAYALALE